MESKFVLPSPNFNKNVKEPSKANLHYLTPCGMTLLPRSKQPPPMYGARGSTVPGKYINPDQQQDSNKPITTEGTPAQSTEYCVNCSMELATAQDMRRHLDQHETCPAENCNFTAMASIVEQHMEANHITGLYKTVRKAWTPEDIAAWRAERCKRFPTAANVEVARQAKEQRLKRGERLEASNARFGKREDRRRTRPQTNRREGPKQTKSLGQRGKTPVKAPQKLLATPEVSKDSSIKVSSTFRGTSGMTDYKHVKERAKRCEVHALSSMLGMYGTDSEDEDEDQDEAMANNSHVEVDLPPVTLVESKKTVDTIDKPEKCAQDVAEPPPIIAVEDIKTNGSGSSDEEPTEVPIQRITETASVPAESQECKSSTATIKSKPNTETAAKRPSFKKRPTGLNYKKARFLRNQNTMLLKLLAPDIRHERNVLLQCVRFVCGQNFFDEDKSRLIPDS